MLEYFNFKIEQWFDFDIVHKCLIIIFHLNLKKLKTGKETPYETNKGSFYSINSMGFGTHLNFSLEL